MQLLDLPAIVCTVVDHSIWLPRWLHHDGAGCCKEGGSPVDGNPQARLHIPHAILQQKATPICCVRNTSRCPHLVSFREEIHELLAVTSHHIRCASKAADMAMITFLCMSASTADLLVH